MMTTAQIIKKVEELKSLEELLEDVKIEIETLKDELKLEMIETNQNEVIAGKHILRYTEVLSNRFDSTAFKKVMPDVYKEYTKTVTSRRFSIN